MRFLVKEGEGKYYDQFVQYSLGPERELYDVVSRNVQARGGVSLPVELSMLRSIERLCEKSGLKIEDVSAKPRDWAGGMRQRLEGTVNLSQPCGSRAACRRAWRRLAC